MKDTEVRNYRMGVGAWPTLTKHCDSELVYSVLTISQFESEHGSYLTGMTGYSES